MSTKFRTEGLILKEQAINENDRLVTVLTRSKGVLRCFARGARKFAGQNSSATNPFSYSRLLIYEGRESYIINEASTIHLFYELSKDLRKLSLAQYFCEVAVCLIPEQSDSDSMLSLMLNTLYALCRGLRPELLIKPVFEIRMLSLSGFRPDIMFCSGCGSYEAEEMYFFCGENRMLCNNCYKGGNAVRLTKGALTAMRSSVFSDAKKIFSFTASDNTLKNFADCAEKYLLSVAERRFNSLEYYKSLLDTDFFAGDNAPTDNTEKDNQQL